MAAELQQHKYWQQVQSLHPDLQIFLEPDFHFNHKKCTREALKDIMKHFGIPAKLRPSGAKKPFLIEAYQNNLQKDLQPFVRPKDPAIEQKAQEKKRQAPHLTPSTATLEELRVAIITRIRAVMVAPTFPKPALIRLWKHVFGRPQEPPTEFTRRPRYFHADELASKTRDTLRHALQCEFPDLFIPLSACTEPILRSLYERFVCEELALEGELCEGVHYFWQRDEDFEDREVQDEDADAQMEDQRPGNSGEGSSKPKSSKISKV